MEPGGDNWHTMIPVLTVDIWIPSSHWLVGYFPEYMDVEYTKILG